MLPSGNDAGVCLAEFFGHHLRKEAMERDNDDSNLEKEISPITKRPYVSKQSYFKCVTEIMYFLAEMNK